MELNTRGRYALMALADLTRHSTDNTGGEPQPLATIAERQQISVTYLEQIFVGLRKSGLVQSARGRSGGYRLARPSDEITVAEIMAAAGEPIEMNRCAIQDVAGCVGGEKCLTHDFWRALGNHINDFLVSVTLHDVVHGRAPLPVGGDAVGAPHQVTAGVLAE